MVFLNLAPYQAHCAALLGEMRHAIREGGGGGGGGGKEAGGGAEVAAVNGAGGEGEGQRGGEEGRGGGEEVAMLRARIRELEATITAADGGAVGSASRVSGSCVATSRVSGSCVATSRVRGSCVAVVLLAKGKRRRLRSARAPEPAG